MRAQHFVPVSGGKDSQAVLCLAVERFKSRASGNLPFRAVHADVGSNEHQATIDHIGYLDRWLRAEMGITIEFVRADFADQLAHRRANIEAEWSQEKLLIRHSAECKAATDGMGYAQRREHRRSCSCPRILQPAVPADLIARAKALLQPTGDPWTDLLLLKGRFPSAKTRFCTEELKLIPMQALKQELWQEGISTIDWIGERADESAARAAKPSLQRIRRPEPFVSSILYRPVHAMSAADVFAISKRHGLKPNPLYLQGARRVGCWPCIMCGKDEIMNIANRSPEHIQRIRELEALIGEVSRRGCATFFRSSDIPGAGDDPELGKIDHRIAWARTRHGGRQFDLLRSEQIFDADADGAICDSAYGLCE